MAIDLPTRAATTERWLTLVRSEPTVPRPDRADADAVRAAVLAHHVRARREGPGPYVSIHDAGLFFGSRAARFVDVADHGLLWGWATRPSREHHRLEVLRVRGDRLVVAWCQPVLLGTEVVGAVIRLDGSVPSVVPAHRDRFGSRRCTGWSALTTVQLNVAELVAAGCTTRAAATRLHLSPHTVAGHVRQIFDALGIGSPTELSTTLADRWARTACGVPTACA